MVFLSFLIQTVYFEERFDKGNWEKRWTKSLRADKDKIIGRTKISAGSFFVDRKKQRGLMTLDSNRQYIYSAKFNKCFNTSGKDLIFQFTIKNENKIEKGHIGLKLFSSKFKPHKFSSKTKYEILFGPDFNDWDRQHLEFRVVRNRTSYVSMKPVLAFTDKFTHLYTLVIYANQTYKIIKDGFVDIENHVEDDFCYCQPREIPDPYAVKPDDWCDTPEIDDPDDIPPKELGDIPRYVPDLSVKKPLDWVDEKDGVWTPPMMLNPIFKSLDWKPRKVPNPKYRGQWQPQNISNPEYDPDPKFAKPEDLCYVGIDSYVDHSGTIWDNILVTDSIEYASEVAKEMFFDIQEKERLEAYKKEKEKELNDEGVITKRLPGDL